MVVHSSTQHPSEVQHKVAHALGLGMHEVRVEARRWAVASAAKKVSKQPRHCLYHCRMGNATALQNAL